jgi:glycosyltransferase involved in cell wall biosynthesis
VDALTVRPRSPIELGAALTVLARDPDLRARLAANGLAKARRYAWREIAVRVIEVYRTARAIAGSGTEHVHEQIPGLGPA